MNIAIDIDDTLAQTFEYFVPFVAEYFGVDEAELWERNISVDNLPYPWEKELYAFCRQYSDRVVPDTPFRPGAVQAVDELRSRGHRIVIITARTTSHYTDPYATSAEELKRAGLHYDKLICATDKASACVEEGIDVLIDDYIPNCDAAAEKGIAVINMINRMNRDEQTSHPRAADWKEAVDAVIQIEQDRAEGKKNILLIGDSIRIGYCETVRSDLADIARVVYPAENCRNSDFIITRLHGWAQEFDAAHIDIVHFNCGQWDAAHFNGWKDSLTPLDVYERNLHWIIWALRREFPSAALHMATTTPMSPINETLPAQNPRTTAEIRRYNEAALRVAAEEKVPVNDLFALTVGWPSTDYKDTCHYTDEAFARLGKAVAGYLRKSINS
ncbi:MAG: hypothetical protein J5889_09015 [Clostridia bacterium]|nr:hypothetical protein [Clostridia bacterium]